MVFAAGFDADVVWGPIDTLDERVEVEGAACLDELLREELGQAVVAVLDAEEEAAFDGFFGGLLDAEGLGADDAVVGGVEAFDVADGGAALVFWKGMLGEVFGEGLVWAV